MDYWSLLKKELKDETDWCCVVIATVVVVAGTVQGTEYMPVYFFSLGSEPGDELLNRTTNTTFYLMQKWYENNSSGSKN